MIVLIYVFLKYTCTQKLFANAFFHRLILVSGTNERINGFHLE